MANIEKSDTSSQRVTTPEFVAFYPHLLKPANVKGQGELKFSVDMAFSKSIDLSSLKLAMKHAKIEKYGPNKEDWPVDLQNPVKDGDSDKYAVNPEYAGKWVIKASTGQERPPQIINKNGQIIVNPAEVYPGMICHAEVYCHVWEYMGRRGVRFALNSVIKVREGKRLGGRREAKDTFAHLLNANGVEHNNDDAEEINSDNW